MQYLFRSDWSCLNDSMWSTVPAVQVMALRMFNRLRTEIWPVDLLEMLYLDEENLGWAKSAGEGDTIEGLPKMVLNCYKAIR